MNLISSLMGASTAVVGARIIQLGSLRGLGFVAVGLAIAIAGLVL